MLFYSSAVQIKQICSHLILSQWTLAFRLSRSALFAQQLLSWLVWELRCECASCNYFKRTKEQDWPTWKSSCIVHLPFCAMLRGLSISKLLLVPLLEELVWWPLQSMSSLPVKILENSKGRVLKGQMDFLYWLSFEELQIPLSFT